MKTGNTCGVQDLSGLRIFASMEPGHEDREYCCTSDSCNWRRLPQWSPVMKTGNTMHPLYTCVRVGEPQWSPVMKTGNTRRSCAICTGDMRLNGARS